VAFVYRLMRGQTSMILFCRTCDGQNDFPNNWVNDDDACKHCGAKRHWRTLNEPKEPWALNENDKRMLRAFRIVQE
jgi:hypothetical protein